MKRYAVDVELKGPTGSPPIDPDDPRIEELSRVVAAEHSGTFGASLGEPRVSVIITAFSETDLVHATGTAIAIFRDLLRKTGFHNEAEWEAVRAESMTGEEQHRQLTQPLYDLVGVAEIAEIAEVSQQRASVLARSRLFPRPVVTTKGGDLWHRWAVKEFVAGWERKPGRPAKTAVQG